MKTFKFKKDNNIKVSSQIVPLLDPSFCYVPILDNYKVLVNIGDVVFKHQTLILDENKLEITSPISGIIKSIKNVNTISGEVSALEIENDYKEKSLLYKGIQKSYKKLKLSQIESILEKLYIPVLDLEPIPLKINKNAKYLIINALDKEPYVANNSLLFNNNIDELLDFIDYLSNILNVKKTYITVNIFESDLIDNIVNTLGTYPIIKLKLIENSYPIIIERNFSNYNDNDYQIINASTLNALYYTLKTNTNISEKLITISGNSVEEPKIILTKLGANLSDILDKNIKFKKSKKIDLIYNGLMTGDKKENLDIIVTPDLHSLIINDNIKFITKDCIDCGACLKVCPVLNNPKYVKDNPNSKLSIKQREACIHCNACSYVCPANINFKKIMREKNNEK